MPGNATRHSRVRVPGPVLRRVPSTGPSRSPPTGWGGPSPRPCPPASPPGGPHGAPPGAAAGRSPSDPPPEAGRAGGGELRKLALKNLGDVRADAQWIVTARLLYHLHDPVAQPSRMQGIYPRAR